MVVDCGVADVTEDGAQAMRSMCARVGGGCELGEDGNSTMVVRGVHVRVTNSTIDD